MRRESVVVAGWRGRSWLTATLALWLGACSQADALVQNSHQHRIAGGDASVTVMDVGDERHAFPFAERYCETYGKMAQFEQMITHRLGRYASTKDAKFDCVLPPGTQIGLT
jgi:hypothetical protein